MDRKLSPLNASITRIAGKVSFPLDESFARFDNERYYRAENASGVRFRCGSIDNNPEGSEEFLAGLSCVSPVRTV